MILVTGASGFIGAALLQALGADAIGLQRNSDGSDERIHSVDLTDKQSVTALLADLGGHSISHVVHAAGVTPWSDNPDFALDLAMAESVRHLCETLKVPRLIFISGWNVYDMSTSTPPFSEETEVGPGDDYGRSKYRTEQFFADTLGTTKLLSLRTASVYGVGQTSKGLIPNLVSSAIERGQMTLNATDTRRDYLHIDDLVESVLGLISKSASGVLNIGGGQSLAVGEVASILQSIFKTVYKEDVAIEYGEHLSESVLLDNQLDITRAQSLGLLKQTHDFRSGLAEYVAWRRV
jgi:nucleoside-diphosphate-sugar epimerase